LSGLSAGTHVITLTGLDSDSQQATDTTTITVMDRGLPAVGVTCQADLGFGGPGASQLSLCGGDLASGSTATLLLVGAPAGSAALMLGGFVNAPTPFKGGLLVPVPADILTPFVTDAGGSIELSVDGGAGPLTLYLQFAVADGSQSAGLGLSNALQVELLP
jgi:hypothetical protein